MVRTLYQSEGMRGLYRGITPELLKERAVSLAPLSRIAAAWPSQSLACRRLGSASIWPFAPLVVPMVTITFSTFEYLKRWMDIKH